MAVSKALSLTEAVARIFAHEAALSGRALEPDEATAVVASVHQRLFRQLAPVIGDAGFNAIFARTLKRLVTPFPILGVIVPQELSALPELQDLLTALKGRSAESIIELGTSLITLFCAQLENFIGAALVLRLLRNEWPAVLDVDLPPGEKK